MNTARLLWPLALANFVANIGIVVTGGAVRLTGSGLGCPTWPQCTEGRYIAHAETGWHGAIEFGNRMLTWVLVVLAVMFVVAAWQAGNRRITRLAIWVAVGVPAQAFLGGITVLMDLNPWVVAGHFMVSMAMIGVCTVALDALRGAPREASSPGLKKVALLIFVLMWVVLYLGTIVTGSGPHAGDENSPRNGLDPVWTSRIHAWAVYGVSAATVLAVFMARRTGVRVAYRAALAVLALCVFQGVLGYVQYFTGLPEILVGIHMLGASLISAAVTWLVLATRASSGGTDLRAVS